MRIIFLWGACANVLFCRNAYSAVFCRLLNNYSLEQVGQCTREHCGVSLIAFLLAKPTDFNSNQEMTKCLIVRFPWNWPTAGILDEILILCLHSTRDRTRFAYANHSPSSCVNNSSIIRPTWAKSYVAESHLCNFLAIGRRSCSCSRAETSAQTNALLHTLLAHSHLTPSWWAFAKTLKRPSLA